jgi:hypothetical protein
VNRNSTKKRGLRMSPRDALTAEEPESSREGLIMHPAAEPTGGKNKKNEKE